MTSKVDLHICIISEWGLIQGVVAAAAVIVCVHDTLHCTLWKYSDTHVHVRLNRFKLKFMAKQLSTRSFEANIESKVTRTQRICVNLFSENIKGDLRLRNCSMFESGQQRQ